MAASVKKGKIKKREERVDPPAMTAIQKMKDRLGTGHLEVMIGGAEMTVRLEMSVREEEAARATVMMGLSGNGIRNKRRGKKKMKIRDPPPNQKRKSMKKQS